MASFTDPAKQEDAEYYEAIERCGKNWDEFCARKKKSTASSEKRPLIEENKEPPNYQSHKRARSGGKTKRKHTYKKHMYKKKNKLRNKSKKHQ